MEKKHQIQWDAFIKECTVRDVLDQWLEALQHCEAWTGSRPGFPLPEPVAHALQDMTAAYQLIRPLIENREGYDSPAPPELTQRIFSLAMQVRRQVPRSELTRRG